MQQFSEMDRILDNDGWLSRHGYAEEDFVKAARMLFDRQFLFSYDKMTKRSYELVVHCLDYFEKLAGAFGYEILDESRDCRMVGIVPQLEGGRRRLSKDETITLLVLAFAYYDRLSAGDVEDFGCVQIDLDSIADFYRSTANIEPPLVARMKEILHRFRRNGFLDFDEQDGGFVVVTIRPSVLRVVGKDYLEMLKRYGEGAEPEVKTESDADSDDVESKEQVTSNE